MTLRYRVVFSPEANAQLLEIYRHIAHEASPSIAERFTGEIVDYCEGFDSFPHRGAVRDDLRPGLRIIGFRRRVAIAFTVEAKTATIIGIFYGGQDYEPLLEGEE
jgi:toxin ParE1/3/4